ncbi:MAG: 3'-5' exonuclease [Kiritimatiellae bacterium]|nr:3'-5' exonuclease [Kiritimatiellia bacterium]
MLNLARQANFSVLDFETTGSVPGWELEPWQLGVVRMESGKVCPDEYFEQYFQIAPDRPFNPRAPGRHAQLRDQLAVSPSPRESWGEISHWVTNRTLVAHNIGTERTILTKIAPMHRFDSWIDTLHLTRYAYPQLPSKSLDQVIDALGLTTRLREVCPERKEDDDPDLPPRAPHDALYDAFACAVLLEHFLALPGWENVTVENLSLK